MQKRAPQGPRKSSALARLGTAVAAGALVWASAAQAAETLQDVIKRRALTQEDVLAAAKTFVPTGKRVSATILLCRIPSTYAVYWSL